MEMPKCYHLILDATISSFLTMTSSMAPLHWWLKDKKVGIAKRKVFLLDTATLSRTLRDEVRPWLRPALQCCDLPLQPHHSSLHLWNMHAESRLQHNTAFLPFRSDFSNTQTCRWHASASDEPNQKQAHHVDSMVKLSCWCTRVICAVVCEAAHLDMEKPQSIAGRRIQFVSIIALIWLLADQKP